MENAVASGGHSVLGRLSIVLATTSEIDEPTFRFMQPAVARAYLLEADSAATTVTEEPLSPSSTYVSMNALTI
jgi:hypothetical protein